MDVSQYLDIFIDETKEHLQNLNEQILIIEKEPENSDTINEIFRAAHSLKGMAGTMEYKRMQKLTHQMENVFSEIRIGNMKVEPALVDILFQCLDALENYLEIISETGAEGENENREILDKLDEILNGNNKIQTKAGSQINEKKAENQMAEKKMTNLSEKNISSSEEIYKQFVYTDDERQMIEEAIESGLNVYAFTISIEETCLLKSARSFLVFKKVSSLGKIIKTNPSSQDIEDEKFDLDFSIMVISKEPFEKIKKAIKKVSEIKKVVGEKIGTIPEINLNIAQEELNDLNRTEGEKDNSENIGGQIEDTKDKNHNGKESYNKSGRLNEKSKEGISQKDKSCNEKGHEDKSRDDHTSDKREGRNNSKKHIAGRSVRVDIEKLDVLMNLVSELIIVKNGLASQKTKSMVTDLNTFNEQVEYLERVTAGIRESVMNARMMPIETVTQKFPRMIRDLTKKLGKDMELYITGEDTELDRTVIDEIGDPIMHLLRNSADHGLETPKIRAKRGKPKTGTIRLDAYQDGNSVVIEVSDDGNGIDIEAVKNKAVEKGKITKEEADIMSDKEAIDLLFTPSFSTAKKVSDISGRGVGLDVVKTKIESLGGEIEVRTKLGEGSTFVIKLPLTLAIIQALMVDIGNEKYAISLANIQTIESIQKKDIRHMQDKEIVNIRDKVIPLIRLSKILDIERETDDENITVIIARKGDRFAGFVVDNLIGQQEIVIKSLGKYMSNISRIIGGATILGDGEVALILDINTMM